MCCINKADLFDLTGSMETVFVLLPQLAKTESQQEISGISGQHAPDENGKLVIMCHASVQNK